MRRHSFLSQVDLVLLGLLLGLSLLGILVISSATRGGVYADYPQRQGYWLAVAITAFFFGYFVERRHLLRGAYALYGVILLALLVLAVKAKTTGGVQRWIHVGGLTFQPSELGKLALILCLGRYYQDLKVRPPYGLKQIAVPLLLVAAYFLPNAVQPDLGTALFLVILSVPIFLLVGVRGRTVAALAGAACISAPFLFFSLKEYQRERILNFLNPERDPLGTGYHVMQSKIAIGSGGFLGKGFGQGTQSQLRFIPEQHTDFIVSVLAEEFGFLGILVLLGLILFLALWVLGYLESVRSRFGAVVVLGILWAFVLQAAINIAMTTGVLPVVGIPLPLLSYGGSSMVVTWLGFGIVAGFRRRRV